MNALEQLTRNSTNEVLKEAGDWQIEIIVEMAVAAAPNLLVVARALRRALKDDWERAEVAELLMEGVRE